MKKLIVFVLVMAMTQGLIAQAPEQEKLSKRELRKQRIDAMAKQEEEGVITYSRHTIFGGKLTNTGYGAFIEVGRARSISRALLFQLDITEIKHPKEEKQQVFQNTSPYIFGKINYVYPVKLGVQQQFLLGNKGNKNGVSVTGNVGGGLSLGVLRPYYVKVARGGQLMDIKYNSSDSSEFLDPQFITGGTGFGKGWGELTVVPGVYLKPALRFDYGKYNEMVNAIEVGLTAEFFSKTIPQVVYNKEKRFFFNAFVAVVLGRRK